MIANDLLVNGDARINGNLYCNFDGYLGKAIGTSITIDDSISHKLISLMLYGKSTVSDQVLTSLSGKCGFTISYSPSGNIESYIDTSNVVLYGIPIESGGNYTDNSGQMWLCDTLELRPDDTAVIVRRCGYDHIDGSEEWVRSTNANDDYFFMSKLSKPPVHRIVGNACMISSRMTVKNTNIAWNSIDCISIMSSSVAAYAKYNGYLEIYDSVYKSSSVDDFKLALSSNPIDVVYALEEPYTEKVSSMYGWLSKIKTSSETTTITNTLDAIMYLTYMNSNTLYAAIEGSTIGVLIRNHLLGNDGDISGSNGSGYKGSGIDVVDRLRIGGI